MNRTIGLLLGMVGSAVLTGVAYAAGTAATNTVFYTTFTTQGGNRVFSVTAQYDGLSTFNLLNDLGIANPAGSDGIVLNPHNSFLLVGGQGNAVYQINPANGSTTTATPNNSAFHLAVDPNHNTVWASGIPGTLSALPINPFGGAGTADTIHNAAGGVVTITSLAFVPHAGCVTCYEGAFDVYYTDAGSGGTGTYGSINLSTFVVTPILTNLPAAHGMVFDPFSGDLILGGSDHITQIVPGTTTIVGDQTFNGDTFDQGAVDGLGHIYWADNGGKFFFMDYSLTGNINTNGFVHNAFFKANLDDIAPLIGAGGTNQTPEPASLALLGIGAAGLALSRRRQLR